MLYIKYKHVNTKIQKLTNYINIFNLKYSMVSIVI